MLSKTVGPEQVGTWTTMPGLETEAGELQALSARIESFCPPPAVVFAMEDQDLRQLVREQLFELDMRDREQLLALVRTEYVSHKMRGATAGQGRGLRLPRKEDGLGPGMLPPLHQKRKNLPPLAHGPTPGALRGMELGPSLSGLAQASSSGGTPPTGTPLEGSPRRLRRGRGSMVLVQQETEQSKGDTVNATVTPALKMAKTRQKELSAEDLENLQGADNVKKPPDATEVGASETPVWVQCNTNAFGAFIHVGLQSGLRKAFSQCLIMVLTAVTIQLVFSEELWLNHFRSLDRSSPDRNSICWIPWKFQLSAVMIFITLVFHNIPSMAMAARIVFLATHHKHGDGDDIGELDAAEDSDVALPLHASLFRRFVIYFVAVFSEMSTFVCVLCAGCLFAITANSVDNVIRSTVSVMFVLNVDELIFESCCPYNIQADVRETEYLIPKIKIKESTMKNIVHYYVLYFHLLLLATLAAALVFGIRFLLPSHHPRCPIHLICMLTSCLRAGFDGFEVILPQGRRAQMLRARVFAKLRDSQASAVVLTRTRKTASGVAV